MYFFLFCYISLMYTGLVTIYWHTLYLFFHIYMMMMYVSSAISLRVVSFLSLYTCFFVYAILISISHMMPWWVLFKVFQKDRLWKSIMPWTLFLQSFSRVCVMIRFYYIQQDFSHTSSVCCGFVTDFQMGRLLEHMWNLLEHMSCRIG